MASRNQRVVRSASLALVGVVASLVALAGCGGGGDVNVADGNVIEGPAPGKAAPAPPDPSGSVDQEPIASCADFPTWREAQDALDGDSDLETALDDDTDGVACYDTAQEEYEEAFNGATTDGCEAIFLDSPDGYLFRRSERFSVEDCTSVAPAPDQWEPDPVGDPEADGRTNGWTGACEEFYTAVGSDALYWGDTVVVSQLDCETAGP